MRIEPLVRNAEPFCFKLEDGFKVWPTNRDRAAFNAVMAAVSPIDYGSVGHRGERMVEAHRFFAEQAREWLLLAGPQAGQARAIAVETVVRDAMDAKALTGQIAGLESEEYAKAISREGQRAHPAAFSW